MENINTVEILGKICTANAFIQISDQTRYRTFEVKTQMEHTNKNGDVKIIEERHKVVLWNILSDLASTFKYGDVVHIKGRLHHANNGVKYYTEIISTFCEKIMIE